MSSTRLFEQKELKNKQTILLSAANSHKIISVLRSKVGEQITLFNNTNQEFLANIVEINRSKSNNKSSNVQVTVKIIQQSTISLESPLKIHLVQAIAKSDNMAWIIQKATELGVEEITPVITQRTIVKANNPDNKTKHWQDVAIAACCQCGRNVVPAINQIVKVTEFVQDKKYHKLTNHKFILSPDPVRSQHNIDDTRLAAITSEIALMQNIIILIGPEGGFTSQEIHLAREHEFIPLTVGPRILRTETAAMALISILQAKYGDLR
jgi:16S rRNA (uracil1498-N3)-methyltransferase